MDAYFGVAGVARKVVWRSGSGKKCDLARREWQEKCFGMAGVSRKVFWRSRTDNSAPLSSDKIRAKILDFGNGGAGRALYNLSSKSARISSAAITIDGWTGAWSDALAPRSG